MDHTAKEGKLNGNVLKMIAVVTMLFDHIGAAVIENGILGGPEYADLANLLATEQGLRWYMIDLVLRVIGRIAFPIFCFLLVEGFLHTGDVKKYASRLFIFALVSEVPFDLAFSEQWIAFGYQNVYFTLFIGLMVLIGIRHFAVSPGKQLIVTAAGCAAASFLKTDYSFIGVLLIVVLYLFHNNRRKCVLYGALLSFGESIGLFGAAALAFIPIHFYNGQRGKLNLKYFFYWFYPVHIIVLALLRILLEGGL